MINDDNTLKSKSLHLLQHGGDFSLRGGAQRVGVAARLLAHIACPGNHADQRGLALLYFGLHGGAAGRAPAVEQGDSTLLNQLARIAGGALRFIAIVQHLEVQLPPAQATLLVKRINLGLHDGQPFLAGLGLRSGEGQAGTNGDAAFLCVQRQGGGGGGQKPGAAQ